MNTLEFILGVLIIVVVFIISIGTIGIKYNTELLEEENKKLKDEIKKLSSKKRKREE